jgi:hypothetical protein
LDQKTGLPVKVQSAIISVPFMEDDVRVTAYKAIDNFTITPQGDCFLDRAQAEIDIVVPKLNFKGRVITRSICKDHWQYGTAQ